MGLKVAYPDLWVAGYVTVWYQSFWLKHRARMGRVCWSESRGYRSNSDREVENLRRNGIAESTQELDRQRSIVRGSKDRDHFPSNSGAITTVGSGEIWDHC
jgi:hypothetical protein